MSDENLRKISSEDPWHFYYQPLTFTCQDGQALYKKYRQIRTHNFNVAIYTVQSPRQDLKLKLNIEALSLSIDIMINQFAQDLMRSYYPCDVTKMALVCLCSLISIIPRNNERPVGGNE